MPFFFCRFQIGCAASEERDIHFFLLGTSSDKTGGLSAHSHGSESSARGEIRRALDALELSRQLVEQAKATAAAERGRADQANATAAQAIARAELAERMIERMAQMSDRLASALSVQGSQMNLLPRQ